MSWIYQKEEEVSGRRGALPGGWAMLRDGAEPRRGQMMSRGRGGGLWESSSLASRAGMSHPPATRGPAGSLSQRRARPGTEADNDSPSGEAACPLQRPPGLTLPTLLPVTPGARRSRDRLADLGTHARLEHACPKHAHLQQRSCGCVGAWSRAGFQLGLCEAGGAWGQRRGLRHSSI